MKKKIEIGSALMAGWGLFKDNVPVFAVILVANLLIYSIPNTFNGFLRQEAPIFATLITIVFWVLSMMVSLGTLKIILTIVDKKKVNLEYLYNQHQLLIRFILATLLYSAIVGAGFLLMLIPIALLAISDSIIFKTLNFILIIAAIIPGFYLATRYSFYSYLIIDKNYGVMDSLKKSGELTKGIKLQLVWFWLIIALINFIGMLFFLIGLIVTIPVTMIAHGYIYRKLSPLTKKS